MEENASTGESGSPSETFQYRGNTHDASITKSNILNGAAGLDKVRYNVNDSPPLRDSGVSIQWSLDNTNTTTINTVGTFEKVQGAGTTSDSERMQETATDGEFEYVGGNDIRAQLEANISFTGANGDEYAFAFTQNGTIQSNTSITVEAGGQNAPKNVSVSGLETVSNGNTFAVYVANEDNTNDVTVENYTFTLLGNS